VEQAFSLVKDLAAELSAGELRLPSLPETVVRIRNTLSKQDFSVVELARLISAEPALVGVF
jgi:HD-like signal output (HDOD) protein